MTFDALLTKLRHSSTNWLKENKTIISLKLVLVFYCYCILFFWIN